MSPDLVTTEQLAQQLGVSQRTLYNALGKGLIREPRKAKNGRLGAYRHRLWSRSEVGKVQRLFDALGTLEFSHKVRCARARKAAAEVSPAQPVEVAPVEQPATDLEPVTMNTTLAERLARAVRIE